MQTAGGAERELTFSRHSKRADQGSQDKLAISDGLLSLVSTGGRRSLARIAESDVYSVQTAAAEKLPAVATPNYLLSAGGGSLLAAASAVDHNKVKLMRRSDAPHHACLNSPALLRISDPPSLPPRRTSVPSRPSAPPETPPAAWRLT
jgi:hypothetical protein